MKQLLLHAPPYKFNFWAPTNQNPWSSDPVPMPKADPESFNIKMEDPKSIYDIKITYIHFLFIDFEFNPNFTNK